jgi:hypothetical protein
VRDYAVVKIYNARCEGIFMMNRRSVIRDNEVYEYNDGIWSASSRPELRINRVYHNEGQIRSWLIRLSLSSMRARSTIM